MASVPNLPVAPAAPVPGAATMPEGAPLDIFAQLLTGGPAIAVVVGQAPAGGDVAEGESEGSLPAQAEDESAPGAAAPADIIPLLQAQSGFPVAVVTPAAVPAPAGDAATAPIISKTVTAPASALTSDVPAETAVAKDPAELPVEKPIADAVKAAIAAAPQQVQARPGRPGAETSERPEASPVTASAEHRPLPALSDIGPLQVSASATPAAPQPAAPVQQASAPASDAAALSVERELDLANDAEWLDRLARDIARAGGNEGTMRFRLHPQTLGHLQVEVAQGERGATIRMTVETEAARTILADAQPRLVAEARAQGVRLAGTEVDLGSAGQQQGDARRHADAEAGNVVRVVRPASTRTEAEPGSARSDRYA